MTDEQKEDLRCNVLLLVALSEEQRQLREAARAMNLPFEKQTVPEIGSYFRIGMVGPLKVNAVRTDLGPFGYRGSAARAIYFRAATQASGLIQLGMAFGVDPTTQKTGDVLVSTSLIPYDLREVRPPGAEGVVMPTGPALDQELGDDTEEAKIPPETGTTAPAGAASAETRTPASLPYIVDYRHATRCHARASLVRLFQDAREQLALKHSVHIGGMLSGGARIFSRAFLEELVRGVPQAEDGIIGGEMEGVGLLAVSPVEDPAWILVKGISDFADEDRDRIIYETRPIACANAARFVLAALAKAQPE